MNYPFDGDELMRLEACSACILIFYCKYRIVGGVQWMGKLAKLTQDQLGEIKKFEERWDNLVLLAYEKPARLARLSSEQLRKVQSVEKELGVILVAYR